MRIIATVQPGGGDLVGRTVAERLTRAAPDGYTPMAGCVGKQGTNPAVGKPPYDAVHDFTAIASVAQGCAAETDHRPRQRAEVLR